MFSNILFNINEKANDPVWNQNLQIISDFCLKIMDSPFNGSNSYDLCKEELIELVYSLSLN